MNEQFNSGALIDQRPEAEKEKDYQFQEVVSAVNPVVWTEKPQSQWRKFPIFNQDGSGSCVAQTMAKLIGILYWLKNNAYVHFSATHIYQRRSNKPGGGMVGSEAFQIAAEGVTLEDLVPSQNMSDSQMDNTVIPAYKDEVGHVFKISNYINVPAGDFENIASIIQTTGKGVMLWFYFKYAEWTDKPAVTDVNLNLHAPDTCRHSVTGVEVTLFQGKKYIIIEDSWGPQFGLNGQRMISEEFFKARNFFAAYPMSFKFDDKAVPPPAPTPKPAPDKPKHVFNIDMQFGQTNEEIKSLQNILKFEGLYPDNIALTGYFGAITKTAVEKFQVKYNIAHANDAGFGRVGPKTRTKLNELYS